VELKKLNHSKILNSLKISDKYIQLLPPHQKRLLIVGRVENIENQRFSNPRFLRTFGQRESKILEHLNSGGIQITWNMQIIRREISQRIRKRRERSFLIKRGGGRGWIRK